MRSSLNLYKQDHHPPSPCPRPSRSARRGPCALAGAAKGDETFVKNWLGCTPHRSPNHTPHIRVSSKTNNLKANRFDFLQWLLKTIFAILPQTILQDNHNYLPCRLDQRRRADPSADERAPKQDGTSASCRLGCSSHPRPAHTPQTRRRKMTIYQKRKERTL